MSQTGSAIYENGTLILDEPLAVSQGVKVELIVLLPKDKKQEKTPAEILSELAALPIEGKTIRFQEATTTKFFTVRNKNA